MQTAGPGLLETTMGLGAAGVAGQQQQQQQGQYFGAPSSVLYPLPMQQPQLPTQTLQQQQQQQQMMMMQQQLSQLQQQVLHQQQHSLPMTPSYRQPSFSPYGMPEPGGPGPYSFDPYPAQHYSQQQPYSQQHPHLASPHGGRAASITSDAVSTSGASARGYSASSIPELAQLEPVRKMLAEQIESASNSLEELLAGSSTFDTQSQIYDIKNSIDQLLVPMANSQAAFVGNLLRGLDSAAATGGARSGGDGNATTTPLKRVKLGQVQRYIEAQKRELDDLLALCVSHLQGYDPDGEVECVVGEGESDESEGGGGEGRGGGETEGARERNRRRRRRVEGVISCCLKLYSVGTGAGKQRERSDTVRARGVCRPSSASP